MTPVRAAVRRMVDVCIVDDELEAAFIKDSARSDMAKYRYGVGWCRCCVINSRFQIACGRGRRWALAAFRFCMLVAMWLYK